MSRQGASVGAKAAIEYGPLIVFLIVSFFAPGELMLRLTAAATISLSNLPPVEALLVARVIVATATFMLSTVIALIVSWSKLGKMSPMSVISGVIVLIFGGLTIYFRDPHFIKIKPTIVYCLFGTILTLGLLSRRPLLQLLLGSAYPGLSPLGWKVLTRNWAVFFISMAIANEIVWRWSEAAMTPEVALRAWTLYKFPGCVLLTLLFAFANIPMLLRHGLQAGDAPETVPPEG